MSSGGQKISISIRIDAGIMEQIKREAKQDNRSLSNYIEVLLQRMGYGERDSNGFTPEEKQAIMEGVEDIKNGRYKVYEHPSQIWESIQ